MRPELGFAVIVVAWGLVFVAALFKKIEKGMASVLLAASIFAGFLIIDYKSVQEQQVAEFRVKMEAIQQATKIGIEQEINAFSKVTEDLKKQSVDTRLDICSLLQYTSNAIYSFQKLSEDTGKHFDDMMVKKFTEINALLFEVEAKLSELKHPTADVLPSPQ